MDTMQGHTRYLFSSQPFLCLIRKSQEEGDLQEHSARGGTELKIKEKFDSRSEGQDEKRK